MMRRQWKHWAIGILIVLLVVGGCGKKESPSVPENEPTEEAQKETAAEEEPKVESSETVPEEESEEPAELLEDLPDVFPMDFVFASGAGAWGTLVTLNADGSFTGGYNDSDMGDTGEDYPHGKHYFCNFQGKFGNIQRIDEYTISMTLNEITYENEVGEEWVEDQILFVASEPFGLEVGKEFLLYSPETPILDLSEDFLSWWPNRYTWDGETAASLSCYGILNQEMGYGFFSDDVCPECGGTISPQTGICNQCGKEISE